MATILLIDDDDSVRTAMRLTLVHLGHVVIEARNGKEGLELFSSANADLLITDIVMPGTEGLEVLMELRKKRPPVKIIAMSGGGRGKAMDHLGTAKVMGAAMVLAKPFSNEELIAAVEKVLGSNLSDSELRYRRLFESAHDGIIIVDATTRKILDVNPFLEEFLGYTHDEFLGKELFEIGLLKDEAANRAAFAELREAGHIRYEHLPLATKNGRRVDVEFVSNVYQEGDRQVIQCNVRDITVRKKTETALRAAESKLAAHAAELEEIVKVRTKELRLSNTQLEAFVYSAAHDLRAPLRTLEGLHLNSRNESSCSFSVCTRRSMPAQVSDSPSCKGGWSEWVGTSDSCRSPARAADSGLIFTKPRATGRILAKRGRSKMDQASAQRD